MLDKKIIYKQNSNIVLTEELSNILSCEDQVYLGTQIRNRRIEWMEQAQYECGMWEHHRVEG